MTLVAILFSLGYLVIIKSGQRDVEKKRGDTLQASVNALRARADQAENFFAKEREFFEILKEFITTQNAEERKALLDELRGFDFTPSTTTTVKPNSTTTTSTTRSSLVTPAPPPPSTTTTTQPSRSPPPSQPSPPSTMVCVTAPSLGRVCH